MLGHLNNAAYWETIEEVAARTGVSLAQPLEAVLEFRQPIDLGDEVELLHSPEENGFGLALAAAGEIRAVAALRIAS